MSYYILIFPSSRKVFKSVSEYSKIFKVDKYTPYQEAMVLSFIKVHHIKHTECVYCINDEQIKGYLCDIEGELSYIADFLGKYCLIELFTLINKNTLTSYVYDTLSRTMTSIGVFCKTPDDDLSVYYKTKNGIFVIE